MQSYEMIPSKRTRVDRHGGSTSSWLGTYAEPERWVNHILSVQKLGFPETGSRRDGKRRKNLFSPHRPEEKKSQERITTIRRCQHLLKVSSKSKRELHRRLRIWERTYDSPTRSFAASQFQNEYGNGNGNKRDGQVWVARLHAAEWGMRMKRRFRDLFPQILVNVTSYISIRSGVRTTWSSWSWVSR